MENRRLRQKVTGAEVISPGSDSESRDHWVTRARRLAQAWLIQPGCAGCDAARRFFEEREVLLNFRRRGFQAGHGGDMR